MKAPFEDDFIKAAAGRIAMTVDRLTKLGRSPEDMKYTVLMRAIEAYRDVCYLNNPDYKAALDAKRS